MEYNTTWYYPASPVDDGRDDGREDSDLSDIPELQDETPPFPAIQYQPPMAAMDWPSDDDLSEMPALVYGTPPFIRNYRQGPAAMDGRDHDDLSEMPALVDGTPPHLAIRNYRQGPAAMVLPAPLIPGHTHAAIDQIFRLRRRYPGDHPQRFPFLSLQTDNASAEFKASIFKML